ncbi:hypothetical protein EI94DRAFT_874457 [Lactarius quietus]|nr:hypothetical protein EI94DRAFT_874457 [Lactarius quietus]
MEHLRRTVRPGLSMRPQPIQKNTIDRPLGVTTPLEAFFSQYPNFQYQPLNSPVVEFDRLCELHKWKKNDRKRRGAREEFQNAMTEEFNDLYGSDENDINNWYKLCHVLRITPVPDTLQKCRAVVRGKHVNLVDLVHGSKAEVVQFKTVGELSKYTLETGKIFGRESARDGGVLRALRRHIFEPARDDRISNRRNKSHKGLKK